MKKCSRCSIEKPLTEFYKHKSTIDGLCGVCKICQKQNPSQTNEKMRVANIKFRTNNPEKYKQNIKKYTKSDKGKETIKKNITKYNYKKQGIYEWYENNICLYIGQSKRLNGRINDHKTLFRNSHLSIKHLQSELYDALRQHQNPQLRIIEECLPEVLLEREQYYIDTKKPLYNKIKI